MRSDLLPACNLQLSLMINCELTWPGLMHHTTAYLLTLVDLQDKFQPECFFFNLSYPLPLV